MKRRRRLLITCIILISFIASQNKAIASIVGGPSTADISSRADKIGKTLLDVIPMEKIAEEISNLDGLSRPEAKETPSKITDNIWMDIPEYIGEPYSVINGNIPFFTEDEITTDAFETFSPLDRYGRCGTAYANVCKELMPTGERGEIGHIKPVGWHTVRYDDLIEDRYLYNRCHLLGWQLTGENANEENLVTGTRYMNIDGMLNHENEIAEYVRETGNHVLYRVTPMYEGEEDLLARGVLMEAYSVEDAGTGVQFCIFAHNVQPGIYIDYRTGESRRQEDIS